MDNITQIIITAVTVAGSAGIWKFFEARLKAKADERKSELENNDGVLYRDDLKNRVRNLEALLAASAEEKEELRAIVLKLTEEVSVLRTKVEFLERENERLKKELEKGSVILSFYRGGWCPYCNSHLAALSEVEEEIIKLGYQIVAISPDHYEMLKTTEATEKLNYKLYSDKDAKLIQDIGIGFKTPERAKGYIFKKTNKDASDVLPVPAVMILDLKGNILFEYINPEYSTRLNAEVLMANLKALKL